MSIDYALIKYDGDGSPPRDAEGSFLTHPLGTASSVRGAIAECCPRIEWEKSGWGTLQYSDSSLEFNVPIKGSVRTVMVHTHGDEALEILELLCKRLEWSAFDFQTGKLVAFEALDWSTHSDDYCESDAERAEVLEHLFGNAQPSDTAAPQQRTLASEFFRRFVAAMEAHSEEVAEFYDDKATIYVATRRAESAMTGAEFKELLSGHLYHHRSNGTRVFASKYSDVYYLSEADGIRIKCVRFSQIRRNCTPYELVLRVDDLGVWKIFEERARL